MLQVVSRKYTQIWRSVANHELTSSSQNAQFYGRRMSEHVWAAVISYCLYSWFSGLQARWKGLASRCTFSASTFANAVQLDTVYRACSGCMNPRAARVYKLHPGTYHSHAMDVLSPWHCCFQGRCVYYAAHTYWNPKLRDSVPSLDAEATVSNSLPTYYGTVYAKIDAAN